LFIQPIRHSSFLALI